MALVIVDTGVANLSSVKFAFDRLGVSTVISDEAEVISGAKRVIIPGVGAAPYAMKTINAKGLTPVLQSLTQPVMGICLGMQLIFETLEEGGSPTSGLGLVPGTVKALDTKGQPSPMIMTMPISCIALPRLSRISQWRLPNMEHLSQPSCGTKMSMVANFTPNVVAVWALRYSKIS